MRRRSKARSVPAAVVVRAALVLIGAAGLLWFATAITLSTVLARANPGLALAWWGASADARAQDAAEILTRGQTSTELSRASALAQGALRREPVNVAAVRTLGLIAALRRDNGRAERLMAYAEALSRRDVPTQLWLIESNVTRNDIAGALLHYDRALRTSPRSGDTLFPILVRASDEPAVAPHVAALIGRRPLWWAVFLQRLITESESPATLRLVVGRLALDVSNQGERELLNFGIVRLVNLRDYRGAYALYAQAKHGAGRPIQLVRDGEFRDEQRLALFDWLLVDDPGLGAMRQPLVPGGADQALFLVSDQGRNGEVASQMLLLSPGRYRLSMRAGDVFGQPLERPAVALKCAGEGQRALGDFRLPEAPSTGRAVAQDFVVPAAGCPAQSISFSISTGLEEQRGRPWIDSVALRRLR